MGGQQYNFGERWTERNKKKLKNTSIYLREKRGETETQRGEKETETKRKIRDKCLKRLIETVTQGERKS